MENKEIRKCVGCGSTPEVVNENGFCVGCQKQEEEEREEAEQEEVCPRI